MSIEIHTLLSNITTESSDSTLSYGEKSKGAGYHKGNSGLHTVVYNLDNFTGTIKLQGTLELYPGEGDWFDIDGTNLEGVIGTSLETVNFTGNFVWIRAAYNLQTGTITEIRYNY
jgi:hypothetical protein